jgi:DNA-binding protein H-NS
VCRCHKLLTRCAVKRKFMRQNRDIARANSTQSLRIRNLENETSRLLAENLGLREQILRLQTELENGRAQRIAENTGVIKSQLEAKLLEISALITGLGDESAAKKKSPRAGRITRASPNTSPDQKNWKNMCAMNEAVEGRLPPILENKLFPRRTLEYVQSRDQY